jgi:putative thioredoxin
MSLPPNLPNNFGRAVDLSALRKSATENISITGVEVNAEILTSQLLPLSKTKPVIILCWSQRSPESVQTIQKLSQMHSEDGGKWQFAHVDIEKQPQVAQALQTRTVPYAVAIVNEQIMPLFENAYPEQQLRMVIDKVISISAEQGIGTAPEEKIEPEEEAALAALQQGDFSLAIESYKALLNRKPNDKVAKLGLAQVELLARTQGSDLRTIAGQAAGAPSDVALQIKCADLEVVSGQLEPAFSRLINCVKITAGDERELARKHLLSLFDLIDPTDPILIKSRAALASALF